MARTTATNFTGGLQFPMANAATDLFKKEDVQTLASAVDLHDHTAGKGLVLPASAIPNGSITSAKIADGTIATVDIADGAVTNVKIALGAVTQVVGSQSLGSFGANASSTTSTTIVNISSGGLVSITATGGYGILCICMGAVGLTSAAAIATIGVKPDGGTATLLTRVAPLVANTAAPFMLAGIYGSGGTSLHTFQLAWSVSAGTLSMDPGSSLVMYCIELCR